MSYVIEYKVLVVSFTEVVINMSKFGAVQSCSWDFSKIDGFQHVRSTVRNIVLELSEGTAIPSLETLAYDNQMYKFLIAVPGRGPVCFCCQKTGHIRQECKEVFCRHCQTYGYHSSESCSVSKSYANTAKGNKAQPEDKSDFPMDEIEKGNSNQNKSESVADD